MDSPTLGDLFLEEDCLRQLERISWEWRNADKLAEYGLRPASTVLFYGPSGSGKTTAARALASAIGAEFVEGCPPGDRRGGPYIYHLDSNLLAYAQDAHKETKDKKNVLLIVEAMWPIGAVEFDDLIHFPEPSEKQKIRFFASRLRGVKKGKGMLRAVVEVGGKLSMDRAKHVAIRAIKLMIADGRDALSGDHIRAAAKPDIEAFNPGVSGAYTFRKP